MRHKLNVSFSAITVYLDDITAGTKKYTKKEPEVIGTRQVILPPEARFLRTPETLWARKAIFSSSVSNDGKAYTPKTSCMKGTSVHIKNM